MNKEYKEYIIYTIKSILGIEDDKPEKKFAEYHEPCTWCAHCFYDEEHYPYWFCKYYGKYEPTGKYKPCTSRTCSVIRPVVTPTNYCPNCGYKIEH